MADEQDDGLMEFFYQFDSKSPAVSMKISPQSTLTEVFEAFGAFLRGAGYVIDGEIDIVDVNGNVPQDENAELN